MTNSEQATFTAKCQHCRRVRHFHSAEAAAAAKPYGRICGMRVRLAAIAEAVKGFAAAQVDKARELIADGGIAPTSERRVFFAISSDGYTRYITDAGAQTCTCPAGEHGRRCYHLAAALWLEAVPVRRVLALAA